MKQKRIVTGSRLKRLATSSALVASAVVVVMSAPMGVYADRFDDQINAIRQQVDAYNNETARLHSEADTLQNALNVLTAEKNAIQAEVDLNQAKYDKLVTDIAANEKKLNDQQKVMASAISDLASEDGTSPIEVLAGSRSIGDYIDQQEYRSSIRDQLETSIRQIKTLKDQLTKQKQETEQILADQKSRRNAVAAKEGEQAALVNATRGEEAAYQNLIGQKNNEINSLRAQQAAAYANYTGSHGGNMYGAVGNGGYPDKWANIPQDSVGDDWGLYNRECVSYVAWKVWSVGRHMPWIGDQDANAWNWPNLFPQKVGSRPGAGTPTGVAAVWGRGGAMGPLGHIAYVETVNGDGSIEVSQYNVIHGRFNRMHVDAGEAGYLTYLYF